MPRKKYTNISITAYHYNGIVPHDMADCATENRKNRKADFVHELYHYDVLSMVFGSV